MREVLVHHFDAFTNIPGKGNPAGIVFEGDSLTDEQMQYVTKEVGYNECCFICSSKVADLRLRYFTPGHETPLCGHATIAGISAWMEQNCIKEDKNITIETLAGILKIGYCYESREVTMEQANAQFIEFHGDKQALFEAIGLTVQDYDTHYPIVYGSTGSWTVIVPVKSLSSFEKMQPDNNKFPSILTQNSHASIHPMTLECYDSKHLLHGRHFSSCYSGTIEDSVTGTASAVMGAYYLKYIHQVPSIDLYVEQGNEIHKEGTIHVFAQNDENQYRVKIAGRAVANETFSINFE